MEKNLFEKIKQFTKFIFSESIAKIRQFYTYIMIAFFIILFFLMGVGTIENLKLICSNSRTPIVINNKQPYEANYKSDMNFLECVGEQHECLYKNLKNQIEPNKILEKCKDETYCNNNSRAVHVRVPK